MEVSIRQITVSDAAYEQLLVLRDEVLRRPLGMSIHNDDLSKDKDEVMLVAEHGKDVIGCVMMKELDDKTGKLRQMAVADNQQGKGIGRQLVFVAEHIASDKGYDILELNAREIAVPFYEQLGYQAEGEQFTEVGIPHLFMKKALHDKIL